MKEEPVSALGTLYQGGKSDASGIFNVAMAMMGIGAAYLLAAVGNFDKFGSASFPWFVVILLPIPLWLIAGFHSLLTLSAMMHGVSVQILEDRLFIETGLPSEARDFVGAKGADRIMDIRKAHLSHRATTYFVYSGVAIAVIIFTVYVVVSSWSYSTNLVRIGAVLIYGFSAGIVAISWLHGLSAVGKAEQQRQIVLREAQEAVDQQRVLEEQRRIVADLEAAAILEADGLSEAQA